MIQLEADSFRRERSSGAAANAATNIVPGRTEGNSSARGASATASPSDKKNVKPSNHEAVASQVAAPAQRGDHSSGEAERASSRGRGGDTDRARDTGVASRQRSASAGPAQSAAKNSNITASTAASNSTGKNSALNANLKARPTKKDFDVYQTKSAVISTTTATSTTEKYPIESRLQAVESRHQNSTNQNTMAGNAASITKNPAVSYQGQGAVTAREKDEDCDENDLEEDSEAASRIVRASVVPLNNSKPGYTQSTAASITSLAKMQCPSPSKKDTRSLRLLDEGTARAMPYLSPSRYKTVSEDPPPWEDKYGPNPNDNDEYGRDESGKEHGNYLGVATQRVAAEDDIDMEIEMLRRRLAELGNQQDVDEEEEEDDDDDVDLLRANEWVKSTVTNTKEIKGMTMDRTNKNNSDNNLKNNNIIPNNSNAGVAGRMDTSNRETYSGINRSNVPGALAVGGNSKSQLTGTGAAIAVEPPVGTQQRSKTPSKNRKGLTVPKSPQFSQMSWQKKHSGVGFMETGKRPELPAGNTAMTGNAGTNPRRNSTATRNDRRGLQDKSYSEATTESADSDAAVEQKTSNIGKKVTTKLASMAIAEEQIRRKKEIIELEQKMKWEKERLQFLAQSRRISTVDKGAGGSGRQRSSSTGRGLY